MLNMELPINVRDWLLERRPSALPPRRVSHAPLNPREERCGYVRCRKRQDKYAMEPVIVRFCDTRCADAQRDTINEPTLTELAGPAPIAVVIFIAVAGPVLWVVARVFG